MTLAELLHSGIGPRPGALMRLPDRGSQLLADWREWDAEYGLRWRLEHDVAHNLDLYEIWNRAHGVEPARVTRTSERADPRLGAMAGAELLEERLPAVRLDEIRAQLDELLDRLPGLLDAAAAPDPPGFELVQP